MPEPILFSVENHIGFITLNRKEALNALTHVMILSLYQHIQQWENDPDIHAILIQATEGRAFCAGGDVKSLYETGHTQIEKTMQFFRDEYKLNHFIHHLKTPYIALMDGFTFGGGVGISLHGAYPIAGEHFSFAMPETSIGFFPDIGSSHLLTRCPGTYGLYLGLTGQKINAELASALGLIYTTMPSHAFEPFKNALIQQDLSHSSHSTLQAIIHAHQTSLTQALLPHQEIMDEILNQPKLQQVLHTLEFKNDPWAQETHALLQQKSPTSLAVTWQQLKRAQQKTLAECLHMDYTIAYHILKNADFYEGVRAILIDKDQSPHWQPTPSPMDIETYFEPIPVEIVPLNLRAS